MKGPIERIVVTLDASSESHTAIDTAVRLAARTDAPLHGVFVEHEDLLHLASLPFARQVTPTARAEPLTKEDIELHLRAQAERARKELFAAAKQHRVKCTFEVVRGAPEAAVSGTSERDLVVAAVLTRPVAGYFRVECRWWASVEAAAGPFLLARDVWATPGSVVVLLRDRGPASHRLFKAAAQVAAAKDGLLTVLCPLAIAGAPGFETSLADQLAEQPVRMHVEIAPIEPAALDERLGQLECRVLALEAGLAEGTGERFRNLLERFACDLLIVR